MIDAALVSGVELLCLDAGNTVIFLDHDRLANVLREATGFVVTGEVLARCEGEAKRLAEDGAMFDAEWKQRALPGAAGWGRMVGTIATRAGLAPDSVPSFLEAAWSVHVGRNLWCKVPDGLTDALAELRHAGVRVAIISNSEGMLEGLFRDLGILASFDAIVDSGKVGFEKPDPRIFEVALDRFGVAPTHALHLGDIFVTDVLGARAAKMRCGLVDPFGHYAGRHLDVPRVPGAPEVARAITSSRARASS